MAGVNNSDTLSSSLKSSNNNIMDSKYFSTFTLKDLRKEPTSEWSKNEKKTKFINKHKWKKQNLNHLSETYMKQNRGIVCGKHSDIVVVDLDFYDKHKKGVDIKFDRSTSKFLQDFGDDYIKKFNTLTFKTANGGEHLIFNYAPTIKTTACDEHNIDIRSDNSYIVAPYSVIDKSVYNSTIKKAVDKKGEYKVSLETDIQDLPIELETWLLFNLYKKKREVKKHLKKNCKGEITAEEAYEQDEVDLTKYSYIFDDSLMMDIIEGLPNSFFQDRTDWYIFTTAMKLLSFTDPEMKDLWDQYSEEKGGHKYNDEHNESLWTACNPQNYMCLEHLLSKSSYVFDAKTMMGYNKLRINDIHTRPHDIELEPRQYLDENSDGSFINDINFRYILIRSDTGTGKTTAFKNYIKKSHEVQDGNYKRFISVVSRISLGKEQVKVFKASGIDCSFHEDIDEWWKEEGGNIVITIDSLMKMGSWSDFESYDIYLDEYKYFNDFLQQADKVIMTDADISDNSIRFLETLDEINREDIVYINNPYKHNKDKDATEIFSYEALLEGISMEGAAMICLDSKNVGEKLVMDMKLKYDIDVMFYSSDHTGDIDLDAHKFVAFSPKVVYGLDSLMERPVFCYYKGQTISPPAMVQQLNRNRKITHLYYLFESKTWKSYKYDNVEEVLFEIQEGKKLVVNYFDESYEKKESDRYDEILSSFRFTIDCYNTNKFAHFLRIIKMRGFEIENELQYNDDKIKKSIGLSNKLKEELQGKKAEDILQAWNKVCEELVLTKELRLSDLKKHMDNITLFGDMDDPIHIRQYIDSCYDNTNSFIKDNLYFCDELWKGYDPTLPENNDFDWKDSNHYRNSHEKHLKEEIVEGYDKLCKDLLKQYLPEVWVDIVDIIKLPFEKIGDEKYNVFMRDAQELERLFRTNSYFNNDISGLSTILQKKEDFDSQKYQSSQSRFIFTKKIIQAVDLRWDNENKEILMNKHMDVKTAERLQKEYELTFRTRSKKLDFKQPAQAKSTIIRIMKLMFGKNIIDTQATSKMVEVMIKEDGILKPTGVKKTQKITKHTINEEWIDLCKEIYGYYHGKDTGDGKNQYEIDTAEIK